MVKLYEPSPMPCLYVAPAENRWAEPPLCHYFWLETHLLTIPHLYSKHNNSGFPMACADAAAVDGRRGSNGCEFNQWLWNLGVASHVWVVCHLRRLKKESKFTHLEPCHPRYRSFLRYRRSRYRSFLRYRAQNYDIVVLRYHIKNL